MKKQTKVLLLSSIAVVVGLVIAFIGLALNGGSGFYIDRRGVHSYSTEKRITDTVELSAFDSMTVKGSSADIELVEADHFSVSYDLSERFTVKKLEVSNGTLTVDIGAEFALVLFNFDLFGSTADRITISYPANTNFNVMDLSTDSGNITAGNLNVSDTAINISSGGCTIDGLNGMTMDMQLISGNAEFSRLSLNTVNMKTSSGYLKLNEVNAKEGMVLSVTSGNIILNDITTTDLTTQVSSGSVQMEGCTAESLQGHITSGDMRGTDLNTNGIDFKVGSGTMKLTGEFRGSNTIQVTSGGLSLQNAVAETECSYRLSALSGSTEVNGSQSQGVERNGVMNSFDLSATSGDVNLTFTK